MRLFIVLFAFIFAAFPTLAAPQVVVSIAPLAGIAAAVMAGVGSPHLLIGNNNSPHTYQMKPSDRALMESADLILWVGPGLETFLHEQLEGNAKAIELADSDALTHLPNRKGGVWEEEEEHEEHGHEESHHDHGAADPHLWLDPNNASAIAILLAERLSAIDAPNAARYSQNAAAFNQNLMLIDGQIKAQLAPVQLQGFIVFHDAYQYFEKHYGLTGTGSITLSPEAAPSAGRLAALQEKIRSQKVACVFAEPQFKDSLVATLVEGTTAHKGLLNADASDLPVTPQLYAQYLKRLADAFAQCLQTH